MIRSIIPLIAVLLFFLEPVFSLFSPIELGTIVYTCSAFRHCLSYFYCCLLQSETCNYLWNYLWPLV